MGDKVKVNFYLEADIDQKIEYLAKSTFRGKNDVIAWLVSEAWAKANDGKEVGASAGGVPCGENSTTSEI